MPEKLFIRKINTLIFSQIVVKKLPTNKIIIQSNCIIYKIDSDYKCSFHYSLLQKTINIRLVIDPVIATVA